MAHYVDGPRQGANLTEEDLILLYRAVDPDEFDILIEVDLIVLRPWHVPNVELRQLGWNRRTIRRERRLNGNLPIEVLRMQRNIELLNLDVNSGQYFRILRYYNILMGTLTEPEE